MGINRGAARLLLAEHRRKPFNGSLLQLGRQTLSFSEKQLQSWAAQCAVQLKPCFPCDARAQASRDQMEDRQFFQMLGFQEVLSCDFSAYENADLIVDLNRPVTSELHARFDVIVNGGTLEHVFNVPAAFSNIHSMLRVGGRVVHIAPSSCLVDHGFYSFSPTFLFDYYQANDYEISCAYLFECYDWSSEWTVYQYFPGCLDDRWDYIATHKKVGVFFIVRKTTESRSDVAPVQGYYQRLWRRSINNNGACPSELKRLKSLVKMNFPNLTEFLLWSRSLVRRVPLRHRTVMPPFVGKF